jgi:hypothetical protein
MECVCVFSRTSVPNDTNFQGKQEFFFLNFRRKEIFAKRLSALPSELCQKTYFLVQYNAYV